MKTTTLVITSLMLCFSASAVFASEVAQSVSTEFAPVEIGNGFARPVVYEKSTKNETEQVMFYIPVYTMTVKKSTEPAIIPVKSNATGAGVMMPLYNNIDVKRSKTYAPSNSTSNSGNYPSNSGSSNGGNNSSGHIPDIDGSLPDVSVPDVGLNPPNSVGTDNNISSDKPVSKNNDVKVVAAAPILAGGLGAATFKKGTTIKVVSCDDLSSEDRLNKRISFLTTEPVITTYSTIPIGTRIDAHIVKNKEPGILGNGALISLKSDNLIINDAKSEIDGVVVKTKEKNIFFNNIKGERTYLRNIVAHSKNGKEYYKKMASKSQEFLSSPKTILFAPFPVIAGAAGMIGETIASPVSALKDKGEDIYISEGSSYEFKLKSDYSRELRSEKLSVK